MHRRQQRPARKQLADTVPPPSDRDVSANDPAREFFSRPTQDLAHFFLGDAMIENMRQTGFWINPEAQLHSVVLSAQRLSSLLCIEPS